jgi:protein-disulfide isomerase
MVRSPLAIGVLVLCGAGALSPIDFGPRPARAAGVAEAPASRPAPAATAPQGPLEDPQRAQFVKWFESQPKVNVPIDADGAKVLVVKFNDYQCPPCRESYMGYKSIIEKYTASRQLKFVLRHFPLERECNAAVGSDLHLASCEAAAAVVMAQRKGTSDKLEEWFFANQASLNPASVKRAAAEVAGVTDFDAQYARALTLVKTDAGMGALLGAKSTPTFVINGRLIAGMLPPALFEAAIQHELQRQP